MTGTLTIIIGLCGSGKTWLLNKLHKAHPKAKIFDEGLSDCGYWKKRGIERREKVARYLTRGYDVYAADLWCGWKPRRKAVLWHIRKFVPDLKVVWLYFKTNLRAANANCRLREKGRRDPKGHIRINNRWAKRLTAPKDAIIMEIYRLK
jgi:hypothetical protein